MNTNERPRLNTTAVRIAKVRANVTQRSLAVALGIHETDLSTRIRGGRPVTLQFVESLADRLGVPANELILTATANNPK